MDPTSMRSLLKRFADDERGVALILVTVMLPVLIGFSLLAIDMSRVNNLHNDLQKAADAFALAAAAELDGQADAHARADRALLNLVANDSRFSTEGTHTIAYSMTDGVESDITRTFLRSIPANDADPINYDTGTGGNGSLGAVETRFIEVRVTPTSFSSIFPASFLGGVDNFNVGASAVAGFGSAVCDFTPVYICNPYENEDFTIEDVVNDPALRRAQIELRQQGGASAQNAPGNYGFLQPSDGSTGADAIRDIIAGVRAPGCYAATGVELRPGFLATVRDALNVRFDIYRGPMNSVKNNGDFAPGVNVRKGYKTPVSGNACNAAPPDPEEPSNFRALPRDDCFYAGTCATAGYANGRVGDGSWDFEGYWNANHATVDNPTTIPKPLGPDGTIASNTNEPPRYDLYRYEIQTHNDDPANGLVGHSSNGGETGAPACSGSTPVDDPDRRLMYGAVLDCQALAAAGLLSGGASSEPLPVRSFASFFITETVESGPDQNIRVELVDITGNFGRGTLEDFQHDEAQLYR